MSGRARTSGTGPVVVRASATRSSLDGRPLRDQAERLRALAGEASGARATGTGPPSRRARVLTIASGKGGVGKTTLAVNLGVALSSLGWETTLVDADAGTANVDLLCGITPRHRLESIARDLVEGGERDGRALLERIVVPAPGGLRVVPGAAGVRADERAWVRVLRRAVEAARGVGDVVIVDSAAGVGEQVLSMVEQAELGLVVATPEPTAIADAYALIKCHTRRRASAAGGAGESPGAGASVGSPTPLALVVNVVQDEREAREVHARISGVARRFLDETVVLGGWVTQDVRVVQAVRARRPLVLDHPRSRSARDVRDLAGRIARVLRLDRPELRDQRGKGGPD